jgi:hypothetical protein
VSASSIDEWVPSESVFEALDWCPRTEPDTDSSAENVEYHLEQWLSLEWPGDVRGRAPGTSAAPWLGGLPRSGDRALAPGGRDFSGPLSTLPWNAGPARLAVKPWPFEAVVRLHDEVRQLAERQTWLPRHEALLSRLESVESAIDVGERELARAKVRSEIEKRRLSAALGILVISVVVAGLFLPGSLRRLNLATTRSTSVVTPASRATQLVDEGTAQARRESEPELLEAKQTAERSQALNAILADPDLVRFSLTPSSKAEGSSVQLLWSRGHGAVLSGVLSPAARGANEYRLWILGGAAPIDAGTFTADQQGRVFLVVDSLWEMKSAVIGAAVTPVMAGDGKPQSTSAILSRALVASAVTWQTVGDAATAQIASAAASR